MDVLWGALTIFGLRICDVSLGTIRMIVSIQGRRYLAAGIAFVEVTIFVYAIGKVVGHLDNLANVFAYSGGFAAGTMLGIVLEARLALGMRVVKVFTHRPNDLLVERLRDAGFGVTRLTGEGKEGQMYILYSVIKRRHVEGFMRVVNELAPKAFVTMEEARDVKRGYLPEVAKVK